MATLKLPLNPPPLPENKVDPLACPLLRLMSEPAKHFGESERPGVCPASPKLFIWFARLLKPLSPALGVTGFAQLSSGEGGVAPQISRQFIEGPHEQTNDDNKGFNSPHLNVFTLWAEGGGRSQTQGEHAQSSHRRQAWHLLCVRTVILTTAPPCCNFICQSILVEY